MNGRIQKERYLRAFLIGFIMMAIAFVPFLIMDKGMFIYYGDYNAQQIPFYQMVHNAVREGSFYWNWQTDLGTNLIGSYSFYLFGSPFFWLTIPFPNSWVPYLLPVIMCLKYGIATLTSYAYIRRFVKNTDIALIGAILYAFSGFSSYNIFFNHFHDVICLFPLVLIGLEEAMVNNRKGYFGLAVALLSITNYYFFAGQVVFLIIYFIARLIFSKEFKLTFSKFISLAFESLVGTGIAAIVLLPSALLAAGNPRVGVHKTLLGFAMVYYAYGYEYMTILQSMFFVPDNPARPNFFPMIKAKWSSVSLYLPLFSMTGVIAFFAKFKKHWIKAVLLVCALFAFIPFLNTSFQLFNNAYYARWFYMPILIMALATAIYIDQKGMDLRFGIAITTFFTVVFASIGILPSYKKNENGVGGELLFGDLPAYTERFWIIVTISFVALVILAILFRLRRSKNILRYVTVFTLIFAFGSMFTMMFFGRMNGPETKVVLDNGINQTFDLEEEENQFFRVDSYTGFNNYNMYWGYSGMQSFQSIIPGELFNFYESLGYDRTVKTDIDYSYYGLRGLTSTKYHIREIENDTDYEEMPGFEYIGNQGAFEIYENKYYVPMGFMYDSYFNKAQLDKIPDENIDKLYMQGVYLSDEQIAKYGKYITEMPEMMNYQLTEKAYLEACEKLRETACNYFVYDNYGFTAKADAKNSGLMVFSVPFDKGWSATVNGQPVEIELVQNGFMAVLVPEGNVNIRFTYRPEGLKLGFIITVICIGLYILYLILWKILKKANPERFGVKRYAHLNLFETVETVSLKNEYVLNSASEEFEEKEEEKVEQSADFLYAKPKAVNAFKSKKYEDLVKPEKEETEGLSKATKKAIENLSGKTDGADEK